MQVVLAWLGLQLLGDSRVSRGIGVKSESVSRGNDRVATAVFFPVGVFMTAKKNKKGILVVHLNYFHASLAHPHSSVLKATAQQHGVQLVGKLAPCGGCSMDKGISAAPPHNTTAWAPTPMNMVLIYTAEPHQEPVGSRYVMFVDSASRLQRPYGTRDKSASSIHDVIHVSWPTWAYRVRSGPTTVPSTSTRRFLNTVTISESVASQRPHTRPSKTIPWRVDSRGLSRRGTRHESRSTELPGHPPQASEGSARPG